MSKDEIVNLVRNYVNQSLQGLEVENPKFDFKSKWYDLKSINEISEFLKDTSAIANTFGPDGFLVIGYNDKTKEFNGINFSDCGLKDTSAIPDIINKHVDRQFTINYYEEEIEGHKLGILHIPPSIDKPHVIRSYKTQKNNQVKEETQRIFIRKNTQTYPATKYDLELMYYDRKNVIPEYEIISSFHKDSFRLRNSVQSTNPFPVPISVSINFENTGRRPVSICQIDFIFCEWSDPSSDDDLCRFISSGNLKSHPIIVSSGKITSENISFASIKSYTYERGMQMHSSLTNNMQRLGIKEMKLTLTNGQVILSDLTIIK